MGGTFTLQRSTKVPQAQASRTELGLILLLTHSSSLHIAQIADGRLEREGRGAGEVVGEVRRALPT